MKAQLWKINVCEGVMEMVHGMGRSILEIYIPKANISLNAEGSSINYFKTYKDRYKQKGSFMVKKIDLPDKIADKLIGQIESEKRFLQKYEDVIKKMFSTFEEENKKKEEKNTTVVTTKASNTPFYFAQDPVDLSFKKSRKSKKS